MEQNTSKQNKGFLWNKISLFLCFYDNWMSLARLTHLAPSLFSTNQTFSQVFFMKNRLRYDRLEAKYIQVSEVDKICTCPNFFEKRTKYTEKGTKRPWNKISWYHLIQPSPLLFLKSKEYSWSTYDCPAFSFF